MLPALIQMALNWVLVPLVLLLWLLLLPVRAVRAEVIGDRVYPSLGAYWAFASYAVWYVQMRTLFRLLSRPMRRPSWPPPTDQRPFTLSSRSFLWT